MTVVDRVTLLRHNLQRSIHDLLHYDVIEVRLLDRQTGELKPLLAEGMTAEAANRVLYARPNGNGVTGYVAHTGKSYLCPDAANDPHYILGAEGARSSMTVPLIHDEQVVGTLNFESPRINGFGPDDLQFTELFSREVAGALHTLDLLSAQQSCSVHASIESVHREIAIPIDDVLACAASLLEREAFKSDAEAVQLLTTILQRTRQVKDNVCKVGREMGTASTTVGPLATLAPPALIGKHVLVIDPDERMRRQAHLVITRLGATVETAGTALEGLAMVQQFAYDAVLMDIRPPDLGGYETYRRLRDARPKTQVAMATGFGYDSGHAIVKARQDGMQFVLFKPYRPDQVIRAVLTPPLPRGATASSNGSTSTSSVPSGAF
jgi:CheY-like chemotaxis protein